MTVLHDAVAFEAKKLILLLGTKQFPMTRYTLPQSRSSLFFLEKKNPQKAIAKRCTARMADTP